MNKPTGYDESEARSGEGFKKVPAGGYVLKIINAEVGYTAAERGGKEKIVLSMDIASGEFKNEYSNLSTKLTKDCLLKSHIVTSGDNLPYFKGMIAAVEKSNAGFKFNFEEKSLCGKLIGANLREEEYYNAAGELKTILKIGYLCSTESVLAGLPVMDVKKIAGKTSAATPAVNSPVNDGMPW